MRYYIIPLIVLLYSCAEPLDKLPEDAVLEKIELAVEQPVNVVEDENPEIADIIAETIVEEIDKNKDSEQYDDVNWSEYEAAMTKDYSYVIILSTKSYKSALERAKEAAVNLKYPLDLRGLHENSAIGLSVSQEVCDNICGGAMVDYPLYLPRNHWKKSKYVSVEYSDGYKGFTKGYYIVVVASGERGDAEIKEILKESRVFYKDAYAKTCGVYMGCGC